MEEIEKEEKQEQLEERNANLLLKRNSEEYHRYMNNSDNQERGFNTDSFMNGTFDNSELEDCHENGYTKEMNYNPVTPNKNLVTKNPPEDNYGREILDDTQNVANVSRNVVPTVTVANDRNTLEPMSAVTAPYVTQNIANVPNNTIPTVTVANDPNTSEAMSTVTTARSFESNLDNYSKQQLLYYIKNNKRKKHNLEDEQEEINEMTLGQVIKCAKYDLFKKVQFIRHKNILVEYEKKGTIGRFVMKKLKIKKERRKRFWNTYRPMVRKGIKSQRNVIHTNIRRRFLGKFCDYLK